FRRFLFRSEILQGQTNVIFAPFFQPVIAVMIVDLLLLIITRGMFGFAIEGIFWIGLILLGTLLADSWALAWLGMWLGLHAKKSWFAAFSGLARIILLPVFLFMIIELLLQSTSVSARGTNPTGLGVLWLFIGGINSWLFGW